MNQESTTILIADDDGDVRELVASYLQSLSFDVIVASDGAQALSMYKTIQPDLVILDGMMPNLSGPEVCVEIRRIEGGDLVPIILLTAMNRLEDKVSGLSSGADDYLTKPFEYRELEARIRAQLQIRELNLNLKQRHIELQDMQARLITQERQLAVSQLAGAAAHKLGQPISAILLQCHLLNSAIDANAEARQHVDAIRSDAQRMGEILEKIKSVDASKSEIYDGENQILKVDS